MLSFAIGHSTHQLYPSHSAKELRSSHVLQIKMQSGSRHNGTTPRVINPFDDTRLSASTYMWSSIMRSCMYGFYFFGNHSRRGEENIFKEEKAIDLSRRLQLSRNVSQNSDIHQLQYKSRQRCIYSPLFVNMRVISSVAIALLAFSSAVVAAPATKSHDVVHAPGGSSLYGIT